MGMHFNPFGSGDGGRNNEFARKVIASMDSTIDMLIRAARDELEGRTVNPHVGENAVILSTLVDLGLLKVFSRKCAKIVEDQLDGGNSMAGNVLLAMFIRQACEETKVNDFLSEEHKIR